MTYFLQQLIASLNDKNLIHDESLLYSSRALSDWWSNSVHSKFPQIPF